MWNVELLIKSTIWCVLHWANSSHGHGSNRPPVRIATLASLFLLFLSRGSQRRVCNARPSLGTTRSQRALAAVSGTPLIISKSGLWRAQSLIITQNGIPMTGATSNRCPFLGGRNIAYRRYRALAERRHAVGSCGEGQTSRLMMTIDNLPRPRTRARAQIQI